MSAIRFSNTYRASPIRAPMYSEQKHQKYIKSYVKCNNSETYTYKKNKQLVSHTTQTENNVIIPLMMCILYNSIN